MGSGTDAENPRDNLGPLQTCTEVISGLEMSKMTLVTEPSPEIQIVVEGVEPNEGDIDGGMQIIIIIRDEDSGRGPYVPRVGHKWADLPDRRSTGTIVCRVPPASGAGIVEVTFWGETSDGTVNQVPSTRYEFIYKDRSARKV